MMYTDCYMMLFYSSIYSIISDLHFLFLSINGKSLSYKKITYCSMYQYCINKNDIFLLIFDLSELILGCYLHLVISLKAQFLICQPGSYRFTGLHLGTKLIRFL